jgi:hypothetical protein
MASDEKLYYFKEKYNSLCRWMMLFFIIILLFVIDRKGCLCNADLIHARGFISSL